MNKRFMMLCLLVGILFTVSGLLDAKYSIAASVAPTLQAPLNGEEISDSPEITWYDIYSSTDVTYQLQMSTSSSFSSGILYDKILHYQGFENGYEIFVDPAGAEISLLNTGASVRTVYWRMKTIHKTLGYSPWSSTMNFIQYPTVPGSPVLTAPVSGAALTKSAPINLTWGVLSNASNYLLQVSTDSNFQYTVFSDWVGKVTTYNISSKVIVGGTYYWRVRAQNVSGISDAYSLTRSFSVKCDAAILNFRASPATFDPSKGQQTIFTADLQGSSFASGTPSWRIEIGGNSFSGQGSPVSFLWNGKSSQGRHLVPNVYTAKLSVTGADICGATSSIPITLTMGSPQGSDAVEPSYETNTQDPAAVSTCIAGVKSGSTSSVVKGDVTHSQVVTSLPGVPLPVELVFAYNNLNAAIGPLGQGWSHNYDLHLSFNSAGSAILYGSGGMQRVYTKTTTNTFQSSQGDISTLVKNTDGSYTITQRGVKQNFDANGRLTSIIDRLGNKIALGYDVANPADLKTITDSAGRSINFEYDTSMSPHRIIRIVDPQAGPTVDDAKMYQLCYDVNGQLRRLTNPIADVQSTERGYWEYQYYTMEYSDDYRNGMLRSRRDPNGNVTLYQYYPDGRLSVAIDPEGLTNPTGHTRMLTYNNEAGTVKTTVLTEKDGGSWTYVYDTQQGVVLQKIAPNGKATKYTYYPVTNWLKSKTEPFGYSASLGRQVEFTTFYTYDSYGNLLTETDPVDLALYSLTPESVTNPATLATLSPPVKVALRYTYDHANYDRVTSVSDERGATPFTTTYAYSTENGGEVVTTTAPGNIVSTTKYYPNGAVKEIIDANLKSTTFTYYPDTTANRDAGVAGLVLTVTDPAGVTTTFTKYDKNGNQQEIQVKDTNGIGKLTSVQQFDALNRLRQLTKKATAIPDIITKYGYDKVGNLNSLIDAETRETKYQHNYNHQVTKITDAKLNDTVFTYSSTGCSSCGSGVDKLTAVYDAKVTKNIPLDGQPHTDFKYDKLGRLEYETDPIGKKLHYTYYDNGLLKEKFDASVTPEKLLVTHSYNNRGQITGRTFTDGTYEQYTYYPDGKLWTAANQNISYTYTYYDDSGRLKSVTDTTNGRTISYDQYDALGQRKQVTVLKGITDQRIVSYDYDTANRPWHITSGAGVFTYSYDSLGRRDILTYPNNTLADWNFDDLNRLTALSNRGSTGTTIAAFSYPEYDKVDNRKSISGARNEGYGYDELYRLLTVTSAKSEAFTYDNVGNRKTGPGAQDKGALAADISYLYNNANQLLRGRRLEYGYDNAGNQTSRTLPATSSKSWVQTWDYNNRLIKVEKVKGTEKRTVSFKYDPFGRRIEKKVLAAM